jgi:RNA polymerase primary sigma factor
MKGLTPKERDVISYFYGIGHDREYALQEIGPKIGMSQERARQLKESALSKMRAKEFAKV